MPKRQSNRRITSFNFQPHDNLAEKYIVKRKLGGGWEGEVYEVIEQRTGIRRAAKVFFPQRNQRDKAVRIYARKLEKLRHCSMVIQYHHSETIIFEDQHVTMLISEFVDGFLLENFVKMTRGKRLPPFEAMTFLHTLATGIAEIHDVGEYHGDLHAGNVLVLRRGIFFEVKLVDFYNWGKPAAAHFRDDVKDVIRLFYDTLGGKKHYANQPDVVKQICFGQRSDLVTRAFPTMQDLVDHLESFEW